MMTQMNTAPLQVGDVQVLGINRAVRHLSVNIKLNCKPTEIVLLSAKMEAKEKLDRAFKYLVDEGFIVASPIHRWNIEVFAQASL
jgi:hypothetical protein